MFNRWCLSKEVSQDFEKLKQMVLLEEFKDKQKVEELEKAAVMGDDYALTHKMSSKSGKPQQKGIMLQGIEKIYPEIWMIERDKVSLLRM